MAEGVILHYLDIPSQHASPKVLKAMCRPTHQETTLDRIKQWRADCPDLAIRSTFIVGSPDETENDFSKLLQWVEATELDRVGCFKYEDVDGAAANDLSDHLDKDEKDERWEHLMETQRQISTKKMQARIGHIFDVLIDDMDVDGAIGRT